jgi:hypothetical protein
MLQQEVVKPIFRTYKRVFQEFSNFLKRSAISQIDYSGWLIRKRVEVHERRAPASRFCTRQTKVLYLGHTAQNCVNAAPENARPLSVDDSQLQNPSIPALVDVFGDQVLNLLGVKGVQVENSVDRKLDHLSRRVLLFGLVLVAELCLFNHLIPLNLSSRSRMNLRV